jgi:type II secretory pathway component GspD/PulD (secretin)
MPPKLKLKMANAPAPTRAETPALTLTPPTIVARVDNLKNLDHDASMLETYDIAIKVHQEERADLLKNALTLDEKALAESLNKIDELTAKLNHYMSMRDGKRAEMTRAEMTEEQKKPYKTTRKAKPTIHSEEVVTLDSSDEHDEQLNQLREPPRNIRKRAREIDQDESQNEHQNERQNEIQNNSQNELIAAIRGLHDRMEKLETRQDSSASSRASSNYSNKR